MGDSDEIHETMKALKEDTLRDEVDALVSAIHGGVQVMPNPQVQKTTILVRPSVYEALRQRIERDTAAARLSRAED